MVVALVNPDVLFASAGARDDYHDRALATVREIDHRSSRTPFSLTTSSRSCEPLAGEAQFRCGNPTVITEYRRLTLRDRSRPEGRLQRCAAAFPTAYRALFRGCDAHGVPTARGHRHLYSFNDDFDVIEGLTCLDTAENLFHRHYLPVPASFGETTLALRFHEQCLSFFFHDSRTNGSYHSRFA